MSKPLDVDLTLLVNEVAQLKFTVPQSMQLTHNGRPVTLADILPHEAGEQQAVILEQPADLVEKAYARLQWRGTQAQWDAQEEKMTALQAEAIAHAHRLNTDPEYANEQWLLRVRAMNPGLVDARGELLSLRTPIAMTEDGRLVVDRPASQLGDAFTGNDRPDMPELDR